jgi:hypothetical protein
MLLYNFVHTLQFAELRVYGRAVRAQRKTLLATAELLIRKRDLIQVRKLYLVYIEALSAIL